MTRRERQHDNIREEIKALARQHMAEQGTAGLSLRAIARDMEMTAPALYRYFPAREDLITALILDAFNALADTLQAADNACVHEDYTGRMLNIMKVYRQWALENAVDFQLIYGNPIPGYSAPGELTVPAVQRGFIVIVTILADALAAGTLKLPPEYEQLPPSVDHHLRILIERDQYPIIPQLLYLGIATWTRMHGMIMLELYHHLVPTIGNVDDFYHHEITTFLQHLGLDPGP